MEKLAELFTSILFFTVAYPATLFNAVVFPQKVFGTKKAFLTCPASVTLVISLSIAYLVDRVLDRIRYSADLPVALPTQGQWLAVLISISFSLSVALAAVRWFRLRAVEQTAAEEMLMLSYPISVALAIKPIVMILCIAAPNFAMSVAPIDKVYWALLPAAYATRGAKFDEAVDALTMWPAFVLSGITLFNVLRTFYRASWKKSLAATASIFVCAVLLIIGIVVGLQYLTNNIDSLEEKKETVSSIQQTLTEDESPLASLEHQSVPPNRLAPGLSTNQK